MSQQRSPPVTALPEIPVRLRLALLTSVAALGALLPAGPAQAITFGQLDGGRHPYVGTLLADRNATPGPDSLCTGTLIAPRVFLTAAHCTVDLDGLAVSFAPVYQEDQAEPAGVIPGRAVTHPLYDSGGQNDPHDIAVVLLDRAPAGITPARLPRLGALDRLSAAHELRTQTYTAVGYGAVRDTKRLGPQALYDDDARRYATQSALNLEKAWLLLSMQPATGDGGTCYGDSGGPHFLGGPGSDQLVSITIAGDIPCRATDKTYRLDTREARAFLAPYVALP